MCSSDLTASWLPPDIASKTALVVGSGAAKATKTDLLDPSRVLRTSVHSPPSLTSTGLPYKVLLCFLTTGINVAEWLYRLSPRY